MIQYLLLWVIQKWRQGILLLAMLSSLSVLSTPAAAQHNITWFPIAFSTPDTGLAAGMLVLHVLNQHTVSVNKVRYIGIVTSKKQYALFINPDLRFGDNDRFRIKAGAAVIHFPLHYYGIGNETNRKRFELYTIDRNEAGIEFYWKVAGVFSVGIGTGIRYSKLSEFNFKNTLPQAEQLASVVKTGNEQYRTFGLRPILEWDSRDNHAYPTKGGTYLLYSDRYFNVNSHDVKTQFFIHTLDLRKFIPVFTNQVIALRLLGRTLEGDKFPLLFLPELGGVKQLRGYRQGRFRDKALIASQIDYRVRFGERWGTALFGSAGKVAASTEKLSDNNYHYAAGMSGYYFIDLVSLTVLRFDVAIAEKKTSIYAHFDHSF